MYLVSVLSKYPILIFAVVKNMESKEEGKCRNVWSANRVVINSCIAALGSSSEAQSGAGPDSGPTNYIGASGAQIEPY